MVWSLGVWRFCDNSKLLIYDFHLLHLMMMMMMMMMMSVATLVLWPRTGWCGRVDQNRIEREGKDL